MLGCLVGHSLYPNLLPIMPKFIVAQQKSNSEFCNSCTFVLHNFVFEEWQLAIFEQFSIYIWNFK